MDISQLILLCNKHERIQKRINRLTSVLEKTKKEIESMVVSQPEYIVINGKKWDTKNLSVGGTEINGNHYYTFDEAQEAAKSVGKRCPTNDEFEELLALGYKWDEEKKGIWVAGNYDTDHRGSLFLPAAGGRNNSTGAVYNASSLGYYWSSSPYDTGTYGGYLYFNKDGGVNPRNDTFRAYGLSVRCVSEF